MSYKELTAADFADKTPEEIATLVSENEKGLKDSRDDWMNQANGFKGQIGDSEQAASDARKLAADKEEARLKAVGDMDGLKLHYEEQLANTTAQMKLQTETAQNALKQRDLSEVHSDIMRGVHENFTPAAQALLSANTEVSYDEQGNKKVTIRHGDKEFNTTADFKEFAKTDPTWSAMLSAPNTQGVGAEGNKGGQAANGKMTLTEKAMLANSDPTFAQQFNKA